MPRYDTDDYDQLKTSMKIERDMLDEEIISQPSSFFHASEGCALASSRRDMLKHKLEVTVAELDKDVRDAMTTEGEKITEAQVKAQVAREPDFHAAYKKYLTACLEADRWEALRNAYRQRADMLRSLVQLHQVGYFGEITGSSQRRDARERLDRQSPRG